MTRWMGLTATSARIGVCLGIALLIGCSDSDSTSGLNLEKSTVEESGVTSQIDKRDAIIQTGSKLTVTAPNGGQKWATGKPYRIKWNVRNVGGTVKIQLLKSGKHYKWVCKLCPAYWGGYSWRPWFNVASGSAYKIKITSINNKKIFDTSDKTFKIYDAGCGYRDCDTLLKVTSPNGGEKWTTGKTYQIKWRKGNSKGNSGLNIKIELFKHGRRYKVISKSTANDGKHAWKIPSTVATGSAYKIHISRTLIIGNDISNGNFTITKSAGGGTSLKVSTPNGGQKYKTGQKMAIRWVKGNGGTHVKIVLLKDGKAHKTIANKTENDGQHTYTIPAIIKTAKTYKIKVSSTKNTKISDTSNKNFTITKQASGGGGGDDDDGGGDNDDGGNDGRSWPLVN
jgi:hypothetical protein